ncbi:hypothetical protein ACFWJ4_16495 [Kitasatospora sp. NPDC127067]|uniref:hypothetical protein n=1 Tax=Kitasatospora sp. NPDC127067 TaxID=3347126 RepID=UPI00364F3DC9
MSDNDSDSYLRFLTTRQEDPADEGRRLFGLLPFAVLALLLIAAIVHLLAS